MSTQERAMPASAPGVGGPPQEVELKYAVHDLAAFGAWLDGDWAAPLSDVSIGPPRTAEVEDVYFDTLHGAFERHGFGARLRRRDGRVTLTVKSAGRSGLTTLGSSRSGTRALRRRIELEAPATGQLDPVLWPPSPARELVNELRGAARLRPLFTVRQSRHERRVTADDGTALLTLDEVAVHAGRALVGRFAALEVESTDGGEGVLERLAPRLEASGLLSPEARSKEEIARALVDERGGQLPARPLPKVPRTAGVRADDPLAEAGRKVLRMHLARMLACEAGTRTGDIEELHKMRVATRRMRASWRVFDGAYRPRLQRRYVRELRIVAAALGAVRDLDVMLEGLDAYVAGLPGAGAAAMGPLQADRRRDREARRAELLALLDSRDYRDFVEDYLDFVDTPRAGELEAIPGTPVFVRDTAGGRIWGAYERVRAHQTALAWADTTSLHALRIDAKRLRYTLEAFREVLPPRVEELIAEVVLLQDHLGLLNDAVVAAGVARTWLTGNSSRVSPETREAVSHYLESREAEVVRLRRRFVPVWRRASSPTFRRGLALAIASL